MTKLFRSNKDKFFVLKELNLEALNRNRRDKNLAL